MKHKSLAMLVMLVFLLASCRFSQSDEVIAAIHVGDKRAEVEEVFRTRGIPFTFSEPLLETAAVPREVVEEEALKFQTITAFIPESAESNKSVRIIVVLDASGRVSGVLSKEMDISL